MSDIPDEVMERARALFKALYSPCSSSCEVYDANGEEQDQAAIARALMAERKKALEEAAKVAEEFNGAKHAAHDMATGVFPKQSHMGEAIAAAIRKLGEG